MEKLHLNRALRTPRAQCRLSADAPTSFRFQYSLLSHLEFKAIIDSTIAEPNSAFLFHSSARFRFEAKQCARRARNALVGGEPTVFRRRKRAAACSRADRSRTKRKQKRKVIGTIEIVMTTDSPNGAFDFAEASLAFRALRFGCSVLKSSLARMQVIHRSNR